MIPLFSYMAFPAIFIFVIGHVATATLPLPKPKLSRKIRIIKFGNHSKTASKKPSNILVSKVCAHCVGWKVIPAEFCYICKVCGFAEWRIAGKAALREQWLYGVWSQFLSK